MSQLTQVKTDNHLIGYDEYFLSLRRKYYGTSGSTVVTSLSNKLLAEFCILNVSEGPFSLRLLTHPSSYFSPSLRNTHTWSKDDWNTLIRCIKKVPRWDIARFMLLTEQEAQILQRYCWAAGLPTLTVREDYWVISGNQSFLEYLKQRSAKHNRNNRRCFRNAEAAGFSITDQMSFEEIKDVYRRRNEKLGKKDYSVTPEFLGFLQELREAYHADKRCCEVGVRTPEGALAAFAIGFWDKQQVFYVFQTAYDPQYHSLRLGALVFDRIIEAALTKGCAYISFASNSEYIGLYTQERLSFYRLDVFSKTPTAFFSFMYRIAARVKKNASVLFKRNIKKTAQGEIRS